MANWENINNPRRKPMSIGDYCTFNDQLYGRTFLVRPYSCTRIATVEAAASNSFALCNWIGEMTYRETRSHRKPHLWKGSGGGTCQLGIHLHPTLIREAKASIFIGNRCITTISIHPIYISIVFYIHLVVIPVLVVDLYKYHSSLFNPMIIAMMFIASMYE